MIDLIRTIENRDVADKFPDVEVSYKPDTTRIY